MRRTIESILASGLVLTCGSWWPAHAVAQTVSIEIHHFPPTTLTSENGYRLVFANTGSGPRSAECRVFAGFVDALGQRINGGSFSLRPSQSEKLDMEVTAFEGPTKLVRAVLRDAPAGCLSATSEVTERVQGTSCWIVPASRVEVRP